MKSILLAMAATLAAAGIAAAQADPKGVTALDVASYRAAVETGCRDQGRRLRHAWAEVGRRCKCVVETLDSRLTREEWRRATYFAQQRKDEEEAKVLAPHMAAVRGCEKKAAGR